MMTNTPLALLSQTLSQICPFGRKWLVRLLKWGGISISPVVLILLAIDVYVSYSVRSKVYQNIDQLPHQTYGLLLGTAKYYPNKSPNLYYKYRIETAQRLFEQKKVDYLLLSGDNSTPYYNEPLTMRKDLSKRNIPEKVMIQDAAGLRTLDSVLRAKNVFKAESFTIISQQFHCERALFIANYYQIDAVCFVATYPEGHIRVRLREILARAFMLLDLWRGVTPTYA